MIVINDLQVDLHGAIRQVLESAAPPTAQDFGPDGDVVAAGARSSASKQVRRAIARQGVWLVSTHPMRT